MIRKILTYYAERLEEYLSRTHRRPEGLATVGMIGNSTEERPNKMVVSLLNVERETARLFPAICLVAALLLSACSQDELAENSTTLPEGEYPLQIGSVSLTAEVSEQPWTRVAESTDGMSSVWKDGDRIGVRIGDNEETGIYVVDVDIEGSVVGVTPEKPVYWKDKQPATITAWYPVKEELDFTHQNNGLTYLLQATGDGDYQSTPINLNFAHQLAKVRVELTGTKSNEVQQVYVRSYPTSTHSHGTLDGQDKSLTPQYVPMREATYNGVKYWEANLREGYLDANNSFQVANADGVRVQVKQGRVDIKAGHVHTIKVNVGEAQPVEGEISDNGYYLVSEARNEPVTITGGSPTVYLHGNRRVRRSNRDDNGQQHGGRADRKRRYSRWIR